ncbi:pleckstrin homology domain-containing family M member 1 [Scaptodrosophila lebanonensis]|uniref:Pleckstrin homology domain-containing family M member 1 n=1 Tax=Drosophila lebanonensis TaxID=7225 RepID=A0A6J2TG74_DROLE|nr:pleckstrin homology domain-containing family M member 1 [Scaptodrosophila lebanonensis]
MSSLFRSLNFATKRENAVKEALINTLNENAREIEFEVKQKGLECVELCEQTSGLCTTLEAIFLHGLKDSFLWATISVIAGDVERRPEPSFWAPVMVFMHKQVIEQIQSLSQITSEIGQCRAWVRQSLNESVFSAYLNNIRKNGSALRPYYKNLALLKDGDALDTVIKIMESLEAYVQFSLPVNSSLLNQWPDYALQLSGLWTPPLKSCPISSGVDIAGSIPADTVPIPTPQPVRTNEIFSESISNSPFRRGLNFGVSELTTRENLELIMQKVDEMDIISEEQEKSQAEPSPEATAVSTDPEAAACTKPRRRKKSKEQFTRSIDEPFADLAEASSMPHGSNSLTNLMQTSWSADLNSMDNLSSHSFQRSVSMVSSTSSTLRSPLTDRCSYNALLRKHERNREAGWSEIWEKFCASASALNVTQQQQQQRESESTIAEDLSDLASLDSHTNSDFELVTSNFDMAELQQMVAQLCQMPRELGLNAQGFLCKSCQYPLGIGHAKYQVCAFSGDYYCNSCMDVETVLIPARIIYNWDFRKYNVSKRAATFLAEFRAQPFIDLQLLNPSIYHASEAMAELQSLRIRLNFIRAYLYTCAPSSIELLQRQFCGREYLYEHIHQYSIADLGHIQRGVLCQQLQKAYKVGEAHVLKCHLCQLKGFICEICQGQRVLYPFHIDTTFRCETCGAVFHSHCLNDQQPCPKCERRRKREDQPLQEVVENLKLKHEQMA